MKKRSPSSRKALLAVSRGSRGKTVTIWPGVAGESLESFGILAPYTNCLHLKEFIVQRVWSMMGFTVEGRPAGQGQVDVPWLLDTLKAAGARFNVVIELWPPEQPTLAQTIAMEQAWNEESIAHMRRFVQD